jgi:hypothetical protein
MSSPVATSSLHQQPSARRLVGAWRGLIVRGGGIFIRHRALTLIHSIIANNSPDQCFGC